MFTRVSWFLAVLVCVACNGSLHGTDADGSVDASARDSFVDVMGDAPSHDTGFVDANGDVRVDTSLDVAMDIASDTRPDASNPMHPTECQSLPTLVGTGNATTLPLSALRMQQSPTAPIATTAFSPPANAQPAQHVFNSHLVFSGASNLQITNDRVASWISTGQQQATLPNFDFEFYSCGRYIVPKERSRVITTHPHWDYILSPGVTWEDPDDSNWSRASLPFAVGMKAENCVNNGMLTFAYNNTEVSNVRLQIVSETCHFHTFDMWGQLPASRRAPDLNETERRDKRIEFAQERSSRLPVAPWSRLSNDHPEVNTNALRNGLTLAEQTAQGMLVDGTLYVGACPTRFGPHPFCEEVVLPSFSLAKTGFASVAMMAMAQEFGDPRNELLSELLPAETAAASGWNDVTLGHLIDMSTGHWFENNQNDVQAANFFSTTDRNTRLASAFSTPRQEAPGINVVYLTSNTFIASAAMNAYLVKVGSPITDAHRYVVDRIYKPLNMGPETFVSQRTWENGGYSNGMAYAGYGMTFTTDSIAKLAHFISSGGRIGNRQVLSPTILRAAMFNDPSDIGPRLSNYFGYAYNDAVWGFPTTSYGCNDYVPMMFGISGISVAMMPGATYFAFNDLQEYNIPPILAAGNALSPLCP